jgi:type IV pilus assembly protein PilB
LTQKFKAMPHNFLSSDPNDLQKAMQEGKQKVVEHEIAEQAASQGLQYVNLQGFPIDLNVLGMVSEQEARQMQGVPFFREHADLRLAAVDPHNGLFLEQVKKFQEKYKVSVYMISQHSLDIALKLYKKVVTVAPEHSETVQASSETNPGEVLKKLQDDAYQHKASTTELIKDIFGAAMQLQASDIHVEPEDKFVKVRFRLDGVLQDMLKLSADLRKSFTARVKLLSKLKLNVENLPQDGRMTFFFDSRPIDVRVSTLPSAYGEGIVLRLLGTGAFELKVPELGLRGKSAKIIEEALGRPNGMIVTTGPTGSGKTTTLYAFLNELNKPGVKIITLEDPVEYKLQGIQQTPIDHTVDFNFAKGLRAILRQDPDIVMVGEIRDQETAETALQASLTGHLVLSTLHTNDAAGAVPRLLAMGVKPFIIAPAMNAIIAQRLVRKLCDKCKQPVELPPELLEHVQKFLKTIPKAAEVKLPEKLIFYHSTGCDACHKLGYQGRIGIYEVVEVDDELRELILKEASGVQMKQKAIERGMLSMTQDGLLKALEGITDVEEVFRVSGD